jgi:hypothetical protein
LSFEESKIQINKGLYYLSIVNDNIGLPPPPDGEKWNKFIPSYANKINENEPHLPVVGTKDIERLYATTMNELRDQTMLAMVESLKDAANVKNNWE